MGVLPDYLQQWFTYLTVNDVSTKDPTHYPQLQPLETSSSIDEIIAAVRDCFSEQDKHWRIVSVNHDRQTIQAEIDTAIFGFTDDVTIRIETNIETNHHKSIQIRSRSRIGMGDLGKNAQNIRQIFDALQSRLS